MMRSYKSAVVALLLLAGAPGCGPSAYARAASSYAKATGEGAAALASAPSAAAAVCRQRARSAYLQTRMGLLAAPPQPIAWSTWYTTAQATEKRTWAQHCGDVAATGKMLAVATNALRLYGAALGALAAGEAYDGADITAAVEAAKPLAEALESPGAAAAQPVGNLLGKFAAFLVKDITEDKLQDYIQAADPLLGPLVDAIERYVAAVEDEVALAENTERQTLMALEARSGLSGQEADPTRLLAFYGYAVSAEEELARRRERLSGFRAVLRQLRAAHAALAQAGSAEDEIEIKKAMASVTELANQVQALGAALGGSGG
ncbi:MAG TPA: hypothetical protein VLS89_19950 [Candidatus Nanopelagicales bacterium]|nr:hypothetical protein [Candidatus Nanopelagicales bacterium]